MAPRIGGNQLQRSCLYFSITAEKINKLKIFYRIYKTWLCKVKIVSILQNQYNFIPFVDRIYKFRGHSKTTSVAFIFKNPSIFQFVFMVYSISSYLKIKNILQIILNSLGRENLFFIRIPVVTTVRASNLVNTIKSLWKSWMKNIFLTRSTMMMISRNVIYFLNCPASRKPLRKIIQAIRL